MEVCLSPSFAQLLIYPIDGCFFNSWIVSGTVAASIADVDFYKRRDGTEEYFEDGTLAFVTIASLHHGFKILNALTLCAISR